MVAFELRKLETSQRQGRMEDAGRTYQVDGDGRKLHNMEVGDNTYLVKYLPRLRDDLKALNQLKEEENPPRRKLRSKRKAVDYLMGDASGLGFGSVIWSQRRLALEAG